MATRRRVITIVLTLVMLMTCMPMTASAASRDFKEITNKPVKVGGYYYRIYSNYDTYKFGLQRSKSKSSGYKKIIKEYGHPYTNGKYIYDVIYNEKTDKNALVRYNANGKGKKTLKTLPSSGYGVYWGMGMVYSNYVFLTKGDGEEWTLTTYSYNLKTKKLKKVRENCSLSCGSVGPYVLGAHDMDTAGVIAGRIDLYKVNSKGKVTRVKKLGDCVDAAFVGNKLYYVKFTGVNSKKVTAKVYRSSKSGKKVKLLGSKKSKYGGSTLHAEEFTSKSCVVIIERDYKFRYSSGKFARAK